MISSENVINHLPECDYRSQFNEVTIFENVTSINHLPEIIILSYLNCSAVFKLRCYL